MVRRVDIERPMLTWTLGDPLVAWYATTIWGNRIDNDDTLFEVMSLQVFQAGLSWRMILLRRDAFRRAFKGWHIDSVANIKPSYVDQILHDASIIRNRKKIEACVYNAQVIKDIQGSHGSFCKWFYDVLPGNDLSDLQNALRKTFKFIGPEIARMWLMASGRIPAANPY